VRHEQALADLLAEQKVIPGKVKFGQIVTRGLLEEAS
jgi:hypothetical protein